MRSRQYIYITTGGTGGHIFPAMALAKALEAEGHRVRFVTDARFYGYYSKKDTPSWVQAIHSGSPSGPLVKRVTAIMQLLWGLAEVMLLMMRFSPSCIVSFGGYPAFPALCAGWMARRPLILVEQNRVMGVVHRVFARVAEHIATHFDKTEGIPSGCDRKIIVCGHPVREAFMGKKPSYPALTKGKHTILAIGGSQGALLFSSLIPMAIARLPREHQASLRLWLQCRDIDRDDAEAHLAKTACDYELAPFFEDMAERLTKAHLVIARAGASTIAEIVAMARPAVLIPIPHSIGNHQYKNAEWLVEAQGGWLIPQSSQAVDALALLLEQLCREPQLLTVRHRNLCAYSDQSKRALSRLIALVMKTVRS